METRLYGGVEMWCYIRRRRSIAWSDCRSVCNKDLVIFLWSVTLVSPTKTAEPIEENIHVDRRYNVTMSSAITAIWRRNNQPLPKRHDVFKVWYDLTGHPFNVIRGTCECSSFISSLKA